jgi:hypothetical protein
MIVLASLLTLFGCQSPQNGIESDTITYFSLSEGGGMNRFGGFKYRIEETKDGKVHFLFNEGYPDEKEFVLEDHSVFDSLQQIVLKHKMYRYKGNYQPPFHITDGESWSLYVKYASRETISAGGYMAGPDGYREAFNDIIQCLQPWKEMPAPANEVVSFLYEYGQERYTIERKDDHALLIYDNKETGEHWDLERKLELLEDLRIVFNVDRLKMNNTRGDLDFEHTPWMYDIVYGNGDHYRYESYDRDFKCGYTNILQGFISHWINENNGIYGTGN